jgi:hypothetical protein
MFALDLICENAALKTRLILFLFTAVPSDLGVTTAMRELPAGLSFATKRRRGLLCVYCFLFNVSLISRSFFKRKLSGSKPLSSFMPAAFQHLSSAFCFGPGQITVFPFPTTFMRLESSFYHFFRLSCKSDFLIILVDGKAVNQKTMLALPKRLCYNHQPENKSLLQCSRKMPCLNA